MTLAALNKLPEIELRKQLENCCGSRAWINAMVSCFPYRDIDSLKLAATQCWRGCGHVDWLDAFAHHPRIGDLDGLRKRFAATAAWAADEQGAVASSGENTLRSLAAGNQAYEAKFGYIFIVCATGKTAAEMLALLEARLKNDPSKEINIAMEEQHKITLLRLEKLVTS